MLSFSSAKSHRIIFLKNPSLQLKERGEGASWHKGKSPRTPGVSPPGPSRNARRHAFLQSNSALNDRPPTGSAILWGCGPSLPTFRTPKSSSRYSSLLPLQLRWSPDIATRSVSSGPLGAGAGPPFPAPPRARFHFSWERRGSAAHARGVPRKVSPSPKQRSPRLNATRSLPSPLS